jgi:ubiquinone/menaquinone biosynthesis C-methylase UbiE
VIPRVLEPEVMDTAEEAGDYDAMDHIAVNTAFCEDFLAFRGRAGGRGRVLDVGTGTARIPVLICQRDPSVRVVGIDLSREMLAIAAKNVDAAGFTAQISVELQDAKHLDATDGAYDAVISNTILHHVPEPEAVLSEMWRVVARGGALFVRDLARPASREEVDALVRLHGGTPASADPRHVAAHGRMLAMFEASLLAGLTLDEMRERMRRVGLAPEAIGMTSDRHWTLAAIKA